VNPLMPISMTCYTSRDLDYLLVPLDKALLNAVDGLYRSKPSLNDAITSRTIIEEVACVFDLDTCHKHPERVSNEVKLLTMSCFLSRRATP
jgi:hypothetical protein